MYYPGSVLNQLTFQMVDNLSLSGPFALSISGVLITFIALLLNFFEVLCFLALLFRLLQRVSSFRNPCWFEAITTFIGW